ncbi:hypothetical protein AUR64_18180 [Haloprofundus marisrubri]|uniref:Uncharacterized protein n=1 Tax=Haloprofundus marisrubri TaxID=1514971 RepID=A0A0W1R586_9EURY|nr:hypothetical protein [Haloprofundus marisrubri]KTG08597.1 hypothetical protein AUR64_18180 [Haloprofundus marisrubri]
MDILKQFARVVVPAVVVLGLGAALTLLATGLSAATVVTVGLVAVLVTVMARFAIRRARRTETPYW